MAKEYLLAADKYVKAGQFEKARDQIEKARAADPGNPYIPAFEERIRHFEVQQKQKPAPPPPPPPPAPPKPQAAPTAPPVMPPPPAPSPIAVPTQKPEPVHEDIPSAPPPKPTPPPKPVPPPEPIHTVTLTEPQQPPLQRSAPRPAPSIILPPPPRMEDLTPEPAIPEPIIPRQSLSRESDVVRRTQSITYMPPEETPPRPAPAADSGLNDQIAEMRRQLQELTSALQHERKAREEVLKQQLESTVRQYRSALEKAWQFGAPKAKDVDEIARLAQSLGISADVEASITREVKLMMYGRAVKEVIAKRKNLKSSSSTLEWLRKVYQISLNEYLEYESQFLMDLVSDQFRGTMLFVASDEKIRADLVHRFKSSGFAVVLALNPESALEKVDKLSPNVIICDALFGEGSLSGVKFLHIIRSNPKFNFIPFLLLSDTSDGAQIPTTDLRPNEAVVNKPVDYDELNAAMNDKLNQLRHYISTL